MNTEILAQPLSATAHLSPLLMKAKRLGLATPEDLERLAIKRGCLYYDVRNEARVLREDPGPIITRALFSNAELAIALLSPGIPCELIRQRMGAAMLSAPDIQVTELLELARLEGCVSLVKYIAKCGAEVEPTNSFWATILDELKDCEIPSENCPHPTRFIEMTGITRGKIGIQKHWIRPNAALALLS